MKRFLFLSTLVYGLLAAGLITLRGEILALAVPFALYLFYGFYRSPAIPSIQIERKLSSERVSPGADVQVTLEIKNFGETIDELYLEDRLSSNLLMRFGSNRHLFRLPKNSSHTLTYTVAGPRGAYKFESVFTEMRDTLGLTQHKQTIPTAGRLLVFPTIHRVKSVLIRPRKTRVYAGSIPARVGGTGIEFFGVREYQVGDSPRAINWHVVARHQDNLYSNQFQQERVADVGIVLDAREHANLFHGANSIFEYSVSASAALSSALLSQGNRVGLLVYGNYLNWILPGYGKIQQEKIMNALAGAVIGASSVFEGLEHLSSRMFPPESQIVLVSSLVNDDLSIVVQLRARGYQVLVVSPDPILFESGLLPKSKEVETATRVLRMERNLLIQRLERAGVQVVEWDVSKSFDQAVGPALMRPHRSSFRRMF